MCSKSVGSSSGLFAMSVFQLFSSGISAFLTFHSKPKYGKRWKCFFYRTESLEFLCHACSCLKFVAMTWKELWFLSVLWHQPAKPVLASYTVGSEGQRVVSRTKIQGFYLSWFIILGKNHKCWCSKIGKFVLHEWFEVITG